MNNIECLGCYIDIKSGTGGLDSENWTHTLFKMYIKWAKNNFYKTNIINKSTGINNGIRCIKFTIYGNQVFYKLYKESGIHRLVNKNPYKKYKRHTCFSSVYVYPIISENITDIFDLKNVKIDVFRSSGAGGQHINTTNSAVRLTHIPTGLTTTCQNERSQHKNKKIAFNQLKLKLFMLKNSEKNKIKKIRNKSKPSIQWGNHIRSYILDNNIIKDLRTGKEKKNIKDILNGKIDEFLI